MSLRAAAIFLFGLALTACGESSPDEQPFSQFADVSASATATTEPAATATAPDPTALPTSPVPLTPTVESAAPEASPGPTREIAATATGADVAACAATASVDNETPARNMTVTVTGILNCPAGSPAGAPMSTNWKFKSTTSSCESVANDAGMAACSRSIGGASSGFRVEIAVAFEHEGQQYRTTTSFTTQ